MVNAFSSSPSPRSKPLADVDERRDRRITRAERPRNDGAEVGSSDTLRRHVTRVPMVLVTRVKDEAQIRGNAAADDEPAIDDGTDPLQSFENLIPSTAVSICGNVLSTEFGSIPFSKGAVRLGSNVSVAAIPPAIHSTMTEFAVAGKSFGVPA